MNIIIQLSRDLKSKSYSFFKMVLTTNFYQFLHHKSCCANFPKRINTIFGQLLLRKFLNTNSTSFQTPYYYWLISLGLLQLFHRSSFIHIRLKCLKSQGKNHLWTDLSLIEFSKVNTKLTLFMKMKTTKRNFKKFYIPMHPSIHRPCTACVQFISMFRFFPLSLTSTLPLSHQFNRKIQFSSR